MTVVILTVAAILLAEHFLKKKIHTIPPEKLPKSFLNGKISIENFKNTGLMLGFLRGKKAAALLLSAVAIAVFAVYAAVKCVKGITFMAKLGFGLLLGGGISNLFDRIKNGGVTDYIRFPKARFKRLRRVIFNVGDFCVFVGAVISAIFVK